MNLSGVRVLVPRSGHRVGQLRLLLHPGRGFGCALLLWMEKQPLLVLLRRLRLWRLRLLVASVPGSPGRRSQ